MPTEAAAAVSFWISPDPATANPAEILYVILNVRNDRELSYDYE